MTGFADEFYEDHVESMLDEDLPKPLHSLSPHELADQGIPVEVALRARIADWESVTATAPTNVGPGHLLAAGKVSAYRDALAIIEAKGTP